VDIDLDTGVVVRLARENLGTVLEMTELVIATEDAALPD
jgi:hypothetical protein